MHNILCLNKISPLGTDRLGENYTYAAEIENPEGILVRSAAMHDMELPNNLLAIARAGAGVNNIPVEKCAEAGIVVFNTPGANANAVKELVLAALLLTSRKIVPAIEWAQTLKGTADISKQVEKGKSAFAGPEILGKKLGVIGLGAIGVLVANAAQTLGMQVYGFDPFLSVDAAWNLSSDIVKAASVDEIFEKCDYITIHVPLNDSTRGLIGADALKKVKKGVRVLNFSRGALVDTDAMLAALADGTVAAYATDFPDDALLGVENVIAIPHLGASTPESEDNCAVMAAEELKDYIENGNIRNAVNFPNISMARGADTRICLAHRNIPNTIGSFTQVCGEAGINIENMLSKSRGDWAYTILDVTGDVTEDVREKLAALSPVVRAGDRKKIEDIVTRHEPVVLSRAKSATFISVILQNNKNTVQLHFGCTVFFEFTDNAVQFCSSTALPNKRAAMHCTISLSLASSGMALQNARAAAFEEFFAVRRALPISSRTVSPSTPCLAATRSINSCSLKISHPS